jgi:hypothetical protein
VSAYSDALDALVQELSDALGIPATRDPSLIAGLIGGTGMVFVGFPTVADRTMACISIDVPVSLIHASPPDLQAGEWLLDHLDAFINACQVDQTTAGSLEAGALTYPAVTAQVRLLV